MPERHQWTREDETLALDAYFLGGAEESANPHAERARLLINSDMESIGMKLSKIRYLNRLDPAAGVSGASTQLRGVWSEYCRDDKWMLWKLKQSSACDFREACNDLARLRRDAQQIIRQRTPPAKVPRREARRAAMRVLYAAHAQNISAAEALASLRRAASSARERAVFADSMLHILAAAADEKREEIEKQIAAATTRAPAQISAVEAAILRAAVAELLSQPHTRREIIINEAVEIAKQFGSEGGHKIVNGALDKIAASARSEHARE